MFGYIKPYKPEMKVIEFDTYKSIYCGLCKQLGKSFGPFARLTLNYDFTFIAMLMMSLDNSKICYNKCRCAVNPFQKKSCMTSNKYLEYCADIAIIFVYCKLLDNLKDKKHIFKIPYYIIYPFIAIPKNKAEKRHPEIFSIASEMIASQFELESRYSNSVDEASEPTAKAISMICKGFSEDESQQRILERFGYILGRWIYLIDAFDDLTEDYKDENYNPFILKYNIDSINNESINLVYNNIIKTMNLTLGELSSAYSLLEIKKFKPILDNIIYLGLPSIQKQVLSETDKPHHSDYLKEKQK